MSGWPLSPSTVSIKGFFRGSSSSLIHFCDTVLLYCRIVCHFTNYTFYTLNYLLLSLYIFLSFLHSLSASLSFCFFLSLIPAGQCKWLLFLSFCLFVFMFLFFSFLFTYVFLFHSVSYSSWASGGRVISVLPILKPLTTDRFIEGLLSNWLIDWLIDWMILIDWLIDWLKSWQIS